jgi:hypothetical protein
MNGCAGRRWFKGRRILVETGEMTPRGLAVAILCLATTSAVACGRIPYAADSGTGSFSGGIPADAADNQAESALHFTAAAAQVCFLDAGTFRACGASALRAIEPALSFTDAPDPSTGPTKISVSPTGRGSFAAAALSASGTCFVITVDDASTEIVGAPDRNGAGACRPP